MATENDLSSNIKHFIDKNQYNYLKEKLWGFVENEYFTDIKVITDKDVNYEKKIHSIIFRCFCEVSHLEKNNETCNLEKILLLHHTIDIIEYMINILYFGKCIVPVTVLPQFMDLANFLKVSQITVYDERGSDYFVYLKHHKQKLLNYLCFINKNCINCDMNVVSMELKFIPVHRTILALYSKKFFYCFKKRMSITNPVLLYVPLKKEKICQALELCYFGQVTFAESDSRELFHVACLLGMERFLVICSLSRKKCIMNDENDFRVVEPPPNSKPEIIENIKIKNSQHYVYAWIDNTCYIFPFLCFRLLNFLNMYDEVKENQYDIIMFLRDISIPLIKRFISSLYNWKFKTEIMPLIDLFDLKFSEEEYCLPLSDYDVNNEPYNTMYASSLDDLRLICDKVFEEDCKQGEKIIQVFTCQTCGEQFLSWRLFRFHTKEHLKSGYLCDECGRFIRPSLFSDHCARHQALRNNECKNCFEKFANAYELKRHVQSTNCIQVVKCSECNQRVDKLKINEHIAKHKLGLKCSYCDKYFMSNRWFKRHIIKNEFITPVKCVHCRKTFNQRCQLKEHILADHYIPYHCSLCPESFKSEGMLNKHFMIKHANEKITCSVCNKVFTRFTSLRIHERYHNNEKPFKCKYCGSTFGRLDTMWYHIKQVHEKLKYVCPVCKKDYTSKNYFLEHGLVNHQKMFDPDLCVITEIENLNPTINGKSFGTINNSNGENSQQNEIDYRTWFANKDIIIYNCPICKATYGKFTELLIHLDTHLFDE